MHPPPKKKKVHKHWLWEAPLPLADPRKLSTPSQQSLVLSALPEKPGGARRAAGVPESRLLAFISPRNPARGAPGGAALKREQREKITPRHFFAASLSPRLTRELSSQWPITHIPRQTPCPQGENMITTLFFFFSST